MNNDQIQADEPIVQNVVRPVTAPDSAKDAETMADLLQKGGEIRVLKAGDMVEGTLISVGKNEVYIDVEGVGVGVVRGRELYDDQAVLSSLKVGDQIFATVIDSENKDGNIELSLRQAGQERVWQTLRSKMESKEIVPTKILAANKGGLMVEINNVVGFLPVSQLSVEHYPRVEEGDKNRILSALQSYVGQIFKVQIITADADDEKLIVSERAVFEKETEERLSHMRIGDIITGTVTGVVDFGVFVKFGDLEGLVHISELAWQRIENPKDLVKVGDLIEAKIIGIDKGRVSLSVKQLQQDPWLDAVKKYKIGQKIKGVITKIMPFGVFVELDKDIQGLAHIMELTHEPIKTPEEVVKIGDEKEFKIISIEPGEHRLGLSINALTDKPKKPAKADNEAKDETQPEQDPLAEVGEEAVQE